MPRRGLGQHAADEGPDDEADVVGRAQLGHLAGPLVRRGDVGDVALDDAAVARRHAAEEADDESHVDVGRKGQQAVADAVGGQGPDQDRLAPDTVRQLSPERLAEEAAHGIGAEDQGDGPGRGVERSAIERQQGHDNTEPQHVDEHHRQQGVQGRRGGPLGLGWAFLQGHLNADKGVRLKAQA